MRKLIFFIGCTALLAARTPSRAFDASVRIVPGDQGPGSEGDIKPGETVRVQVYGVKPVDYQFFCWLHEVVTGKGKHRRGALRVAS